jgi:hypothetical protein
MPARRSVRCLANHPGFLDDSGALRFMAHDRWRRICPPRVNASVQRVAIQQCSLPCGHAHALTPASPPACPQLSRPAIAASSRPHQRSFLRCKAPLILPCAPGTRTQDPRRNVRVGDVSRMRILWRGGGRRRDSPPDAGAGFTLSPQSVATGESPLYSSYRRRPVSSRRGIAASGSDSNAWAPAFAGATKNVDRQPSRTSDPSRPSACADNH